MEENRNYYEISMKHAKEMKNIQNLVNKATKKYGLMGNRQAFDKCLRLFLITIYIENEIRMYSHCTIIFHSSISLLEEKILNNIESKQYIEEQIFSLSKQNNEAYKQIINDLENSILFINRENGFGFLDVDNICDRLVDLLQEHINIYKEMENES